MGKPAWTGQDTPCEGYDRNPIEISRPIKRKNVRCPTHLLLCVHLKVVGNHILILNGSKDVEELFSKLGPSNSEGPHVVMAGWLF
jgi:hypothetical protein